MKINKKHVLFFVVFVFASLLLVWNYDRVTAYDIIDPAPDKVSMPEIQIKKDSPNQQADLIINNVAGGGGIEQWHVSQKYSRNDPNAPNYYGTTNPFTPGQAAPAYVEAEFDDAFNWTAGGMQKRDLENNAYASFAPGYKATNLLIPYSTIENNPNLELEFMFKGNAELKETDANGVDMYRPLDVRVTISDIIPIRMYNDPYNSATNWEHRFAETDYQGVALQVSDNLYSGIMKINAEAMKVKYEFIDPTTGNLVPDDLSVNLTFNSLNHYVRDNNDTTSEFVAYLSNTPNVNVYRGQNIADKTFTSTAVPVFSGQTTPDGHEFTLSSGANSYLQQFDGTEIFYGDSQADFVDELDNENYTKNTVVFSSTGPVHEVLLGSDNNYGNGFAGIFNNGKAGNGGWQSLDTGGLFLQGPPTVRKTVSDIDENDVYSNVFNGAETMVYRGTQQINILGQNTSKIYDSFTMTDRLPAEVDYVSSRLIRQYKNPYTGVINTEDLTATFTPTYDANSHTVSFVGDQTFYGYYDADGNLQYGALSYANEETIALEITVKPNDLILDKYEVVAENEIEVEVNNEIKRSNTVTSRNNVPEFPEVKKTVSDSDEFNVLSDMYKPKDKLVYKINQPIYKLSTERRAFSTLTIYDRLPKEVEYVSARLLKDGTELTAYQPVYHSNDHVVEFFTNDDAFLGHYDDAGNFVKGVLDYNEEILTLEVTVKPDAKNKKTIYNDAHSIFNQSGAGGYQDPTGVDKTSNKVQSIPTKKPPKAGLGSDNMRNIGLSLLVILSGSMIFVKSKRSWI